MNRFALPLVGLGLLLVLFAIALQRAPEKTTIPSALIGKPMPGFSLPDLLQPGGTVNSADFKGRWLLVNIWGTWCEPCRQEHPVLLDIAKEGKITLLGINYNDVDETARNWLAQLGNPYDAVGVDRQGNAALDFGVYGAPESFIINPEGVVVHKVVGIVTGREWQEKILPLIEAGSS
jgi:cytochrome c biogenesis protein CcmG/thiol:disulfide interchange protein DsbE